MKQARYFYARQPIFAALSYSMFLKELLLLVGRLPVWLEYRQLSLGRNLNDLTLRVRD